jgi:hypothetical protein
MTNEPNARAATSRGRTIAIIVLALVAIVGGLLNACRAAPATPEAVGSSVSAITTADIVSADAGYTNASNTSSASGLGGNDGVIQLVVFRGGSSPNNGFGVRVSGSTSMTATEGTSTNWGAPTLADGHVLAAYTGPIKVASMRESGKFVIASVASSDDNNNTDIVLITTTNGGTSFQTTLTTSVLCTFLNNSDDMEECPGATIIYSIALAVDPNLSALAPGVDGGATTYHDAYLYFTTPGSPSRNLFLYEFYVDDLGGVHQENVGNLTQPSWVGYGTNADTFTMVVGKEKSCNGGNVFLYGAVASRNPLDDGTCPISTASTTSYQTEYLVDPDSLDPDWHQDLAAGSLSGTQPDCIGSQVNWPAAGLAFDPTPTPDGPGGGGSVRIAISYPKTNGQRIQIFDTNPLGCSGSGTSCTDCCNGTCSETTPGFTSDDGCELMIAGVGTMIVDCNDPRCVHAADAGETCTVIEQGLDEILPQVAYNTDNYISVTWYDNRNGDSGLDGGLPRPYGQIQGTSGASEYAVDMTAYSSTIVPASSEGTTVAPRNLCIGMSQESSASDWFGSSNGDSLVFGYQYPN